MRLYEEDIPSFALRFSFQSNMAFLISVFILSCALAWALRDHRRRMLELATEENEDRLYLTILAILFCICAMGSYYSFNRVQPNMAGQFMTQNIMLEELKASMKEWRDHMNQRSRTYVPYMPDAPTKLPIPKRKLLEEHIRKEKRHPDEEYQGLSMLIMLISVMFSIWYFYPWKKRPDIAPPKDYLGSKGRLGETKMPSSGASSSTVKSSQRTKSGSNSEAVEMTGSRASKSGSNASQTKRTSTGTSRLLSGSKAKSTASAGHPSVGPSTKASSTKN